MKPERVVGFDLADRRSSSVQNLTRSVSQSSIRSESSVKSALSQSLSSEKGIEDDENDANYMSHDVDVDMEIIDEIEDEAQGAVDIPWHKPWSNYKRVNCKTINRNIDPWRVHMKMAANVFTFWNASSYPQKRMTVSEIFRTMNLFFRV